MGKLISQVTVTWTHPWGCIETTWIYFTFEHYANNHVKIWIIRHDLLINNKHLAAFVAHKAIFKVRQNFGEVSGRGGLWFAKGETCIYYFNSRPLKFMTHCTTTHFGANKEEEGKTRQCKLYKSLQSRLLLLFSKKKNNHAVIFREVTRYSIFFAI